MKITGLNHITFAVHDVNRSIQFYTEILGLRLIAKWSTGAYLTAGQTWIALNQDSTIKQTHRPDSSHIAFSCSQSDFEPIRLRILEYGCMEWSRNTYEENSLYGSSVYFLDPDGHHLELHVGDLESRLQNMHENPWEDDFAFY
jgi:catechol 2,3-dioxygenase-like lactoylglutathione lyase family enzyme